MDIQVVLTENDPKLGKRGEVVKVSAGFAQNYLFPHKKAQPATPANLKTFEAQKAKQTKEDAERLNRARSLAEKLKTSPLQIPVTAGEGDKLFGAVTAQHIVEALGSRAMVIEKKMVHLEEPLKKIGRHEVELRLHPEVTMKLLVEIVKK